MSPQILISVIFLLMQNTQAIKNVRVTSDSNTLFRDQSSEVLCTYITWKQEQFYGVKWTVEYSGVEATILEYSSDGSIETPTKTFVQADPESATEKKVDLRIQQGSDPEKEVTICCEVKVLKDSGYGNMRALKKKHCSEFDVVTGTYLSKFECRVSIECVFSLCFCAVYVIFVILPPTADLNKSSKLRQQMGLL